MTGSTALRQNFWWLRDSHNPVLPPGDAGSFDSGCAMNPCALRVGDEYHLYYAGADARGLRRICLATVPVHAVSDPAAWTRHGPLFDVGPAGSFDAHWCVLPHLVRTADDRWHLYYTGRTDHGEGLSAFPGLGLAVSRDGKSWEKHPGNPIIAPTHRAGDPDRMGLAGGSVLLARLPDGTTEWRFYYTGCPTLGSDVFLNQQKRACLAVSQDGITWERRGALMLRNPHHDYENVATAGPVVRQEEDGTFRMWYSAIGTRWGYYSIAYAESEDGLAWRRGERYGDNLQLGPTGAGWERQMVEYPSVLPDASDPAGRRLRLFYCGNGYGVSGIGTAVSSPLRATPDSDEPTLRVVSNESDPAGAGAWTLKLPDRLTVGDEALTGGTGRWHGPDASGTYWYEWQDVHGTEGLQYRVLVSHTAAGLGVRVALINGARRDYRGVELSAAVQSVNGTSAPPEFQWEGQESGAAVARLDVLEAGETKVLTGQVTLSATDGSRG